MSELAERSHYTRNAQAEKCVYGEMALFLLEEMWEKGVVSVPGREQAWEAISQIAEHRPPSAGANPAAAHKLLARHAIEGSASIVCTDTESGFQISLEVDDGVFNPELTKATPLLLNVVGLAELTGSRFLDAFAGSGILGVYAASMGAEVIAYDTSAAAVACAQKNAFRNMVADKITVRTGDLRCLAADEQFDIISANPPLLPVVPPENQPLASAVFDPELQATIDFIGALPGLLAPDGRCYLLTSSTFDQDGRDMYALCEQNGLTARLVAAEPRTYEWYRVHQIRHT